ncbi:MAG: GNAT family N-acetyltransferase [Lachnospiraceae bacterium]|nr:GNAT family N-acetyltransferase [Lachnospiraceae bacterium]
MYPILETERLFLSPLQESDFDGMYKLYSDETVISDTEMNLYTDPVKFKKDLIVMIRNQNIMTIRLRKTDEFIGFIGCHQIIDKKKCAVKHSQIWTALLPEYWEQGYCTEATKKLLYFVFVGIKSPWICANQFQTNPTAGKVLKKCGFNLHAIYKMDNKPYDQYRYTQKDYIKDNPEAEKDTYDYIFPIKKSPYNYENPIRTIDGITYIEQPTGYLCGQSVIAMLAGVSVDEVIDVMLNDKGTAVSEIGNTLFYYGIKHNKKRTPATNDTPLPEICILSMKLPGYGHWSLFYKGKYYDPEFGVADKLPEKAVLKYYWEIFN